ncbi:Fic family protein [Nocardioides flavescens]|uniref:Fic family protein n=1 Tax=Nocardioides flavescens TaxID=2691959 RepID=A0A6L7F4F2_9ACTN|nr:Fic family protein [Nocardioides flavescens]MXG92074.1 Fic family protein [Nocardioides flavescens]
MSSPTDEPGPAPTDAVDPGLALTYETHEWDRSGEDDSLRMSRRARLAARGPYRAAVPPEIADHEFAIDPAALAEAEDALLEIARFDTELSATRYAEETDGETDRSGEFAPLAAILLRTESASSSQIENVTAGAKALAMAAIHEKSGPNAQMVAANVEAMERAVAASDDLSEASILAAHAALMAGQEHARPGRYRESQVWIGSGASTPHTASFVPPHEDRVQPAMADLIVFCERTDLPVLAHVAIAHAQFETIHPFADGNGRTGRALVHVMLKRAGVTRRITVPVSAGLLGDTAGYFGALTAYRAGDPRPIVEQFSRATFTAVTNGRTLKADVDAIHQGWTETLTSRRGSAARRMLPHLLRQPAVTVRMVEQLLSVSNPAALRAIDTLVADGILTSASENRRNRVWIAEEVIAALDEFAARAVRRP